MVVVIADTSTLMIYEGTTLKWSAQLPFAPVTVGRAQLQVRISPLPHPSAAKIPSRHCTYYVHTQSRSSSVH